MKVLVRLAIIEKDSMPGIREENALAILANLSVQDEVSLSILPVSKMPRPLILRQISLTFFLDGRDGAGLSEQSGVSVWGLLDIPGF